MVTFATRSKKICDETCRRIGVWVSVRCVYVSHQSRIHVEHFGWCSSEPRQIKQADCKCGNTKVTMSRLRFGMGSYMLWSSKEAEANHVEQACFAA
jgi:hypothetical protein